MPHRIQITDRDIQYAESILLPSGEKFDEERTRFIKELRTVDLQACPGSGKTTCLLAKLVALSKYLPFENDSGILVLSHTNAAVDEIKNKILTHCPQLFDPPNFIGTIQGFVDNFLAIPFYMQEYGHQPYRIDDEIFKERIKKLVAHPKYSALRVWLSNQHASEEILHSLKFDANGKLVSISALPKETTATYKSLCEIKESLLKEGYLRFDDAFYVSECYINKFPQIGRLLQKRFAFIFIDEMQDTDTHQISVLNKVFPPTGSSVIQRIGDQNQAIYGHRVKSETAWSPANNSLCLNGSKRLSVNIAAAIKNISLSPQDLAGNSKRKNIKPKLLLFESATIKNVPKKFCDILVENGLQERNPAIFKAVGWVKKPKNNGEITIGSYFDNYQSIARKDKLDFDCLSEYLLFTPEELKTCGLVRPSRMILAAFVKALRIADKRKSDGMPFTVQSLLSFLKENHPKEYDALRSNLYAWSLAVCHGSNIYDSLVKYLKRFFGDVFSINASIGGINSFLTSTPGEPVQAAPQIPTTIFRQQSGSANIEVEIATIHSIKGETHTATLYLETFYYNDGGKSYESQRLIEQLKGNRITGTIGRRVRESLKMAYVGMSRPTDLLCVAVHKSHIPNTEIQHLQNNWDIVYV